MSETRLDEERSRNLISLGLPDPDWYERTNNFEYSTDELISFLPREIDDFGLVIAPYPLTGWAVSYVDFDRPLPSDSKVRFAEYHKEIGGELIDAVYKMLVSLLKIHEI